MGTAQTNRNGQDGPLKVGDKILIAQTYWDESEANAALIAAAPELYREVQLIRDFLVELSLDKTWADQAGMRNMIVRVSKTLTKARGEL